MKDLQDIKSQAISLLQNLIETPSISKEEHATAAIFESIFAKANVNYQRHLNNVFALSHDFDPNKPSILLNSHHDTVKPNATYTRDPFAATIKNDMLFGLGSNDAGGPLVALWATFMYFNDLPNKPFNLVFAATAEEEISGKNGIEAILPLLPKIDLAIVGEPTGMQLAVAEKGLLVLDCVATGLAGHAARNEGKNAIYAAIEDINWFQNFVFEKESAILGPIKMSITLISAGTQHNVVPDTCSFVVDVRLTDAYTLEETLAIIQSHVKCIVNPRSTRLKPSGISSNHPVVQKGISMGWQTYGSPTLSDQALMPFRSIKLGPGQSSRSHTSDEFILLSEINAGIDGYIQLLTDLQL